MTTTEGIVNHYGEFYGRYELEEDSSGGCKLVIYKPSKNSRVIQSKDEGRRVILEDTEDPETITGDKNHLMDSLRMRFLELVEN